MLHVSDKDDGEEILGDLFEDDDYGYTTHEKTYAPYSSYNSYNNEVHHVSHSHTPSYATQGHSSNFNQIIGNNYSRNQSYSLVQLNFNQIPVLTDGGIKIKSIEPHSQNQYIGLNSIPILTSTGIKVKPRVPERRMTPIIPPRPIMSAVSTIREHPLPPPKPRYRVKNRICTHCGKAYSRNQQLKLHIKTKHLAQPKADGTPGQMYECEICKLTFNKQSHLNYHRILHNLETFKCPVCEITFNTKHVLDGHIILHSEDLVGTPYVCPICWKGIEEKIEFDAHMEGVHPEELSTLDSKPYKCFLCDTQDSRFSKFKNLKVHMSNFHKFGVKAVAASTSDIPRLVVPLKAESPSLLLEITDAETSEMSVETNEEIQTPSLNQMLVE